MPILCTIGSPFCVTTTWQNRLAWFPAGETLSVLMWKTRSVVSLVIFLTSVVTLLGRPIRVTCGLAGEVDGLGDLDRHVDSLPLLDARGLERQADDGSGDGQVGQLRRDHDRPRRHTRAAVDDDLPGPQLGPAVGVHRDDAPRSGLSGIAMPPAEPTPGGFHGR